MRHVKSLVRAAVELPAVARPLPAVRFPAVLRALQSVASGILVLAALLTVLAMLLVPGASDSFTTGRGVGLFAAGALVAVLASLTTLLASAAAYLTSEKAQRGVVVERLGWSHGVALLGFIAAVVVFNLRA